MKKIESWNIYSFTPLFSRQIAKQNIPTRRNVFIFLASGVIYWPMLGTRKTSVCHSENLQAYPDFWFNFVRSLKKISFIWSNAIWNNAGLLHVKISLKPLCGILSRHSWIGYNCHVQQVISVVRIWKHLNMGLVTHLMVLAEGVRAKLFGET